MLDNTLRNDFVNVLLQIPVMGDYNTRTHLLDSLPYVAINRSAANAQLDLLEIIGGLDMVGRLDDAGGTRPLVVVAQNALRFVPTGSTVGKKLQDVIQRLEQYYGGEFQPAPISKPVPGEEIVFGIDERVDFAFMQQGLAVSRSVARLQVPRIFNGTLANSTSYGTGWLIAPGLMITNHHVINARFKQPPHNEQDAAANDFQAQADGTLARFDYYTEGENASYLECAGAELVAANQGLDYALIRLKEANKITDRPRLPLVEQQPSLVPGARMNIVQYPKGGPLKYAIRHNFYTAPGGDTFLRYVTDTEPGASGSPVLNDTWQVVALHHAAVPVTDAQAPAAVGMIASDTVTGTAPANLYLNEGIAIHKILEHLQSLNAAIAQEIKAAQGW